ncbi:MAG: DUF1015 family protein [Dehalococcoidia bacterium]
MPQIIPIRGIRYTAEAGSLGDLLAPPYDVISASQQAALAARSPHNGVHLELAAGGEERYARVAALFSEWQDQAVVARDPLPMLYLYEQTFVEAGREFQRRALIAGVEAQPWEEGAVRPHEFTMSGPKEDRLKLLEATRTQFSPVFMIARDRAGQLRQFLDETMASRPADLEAASLEGDHHRLWLIEAGRFEMRRLAPLLSESFTIADGHHRYETAVTYKQQRLAEGALERDHPARFALTAIVPADDPGLVIRPIHRVVARPVPADWEARLSAHLTVEAVDTASIADVQRVASEAPAGAIVALGLAAGQAHVLLPRDSSVYAALAPRGRSEGWTQIPPNLCRYAVLKPLWGISDADLAAGAVEYTHDATEAWERVTGGACAFLLQPVSIGDTIALSDAGERMPQKSTFFHPKLGTGLVFHPLYP